MTHHLWIIKTVMKCKWWTAEQFILLFPHLKASFIATKTTSELITNIIIWWQRIQYFATKRFTSRTSNKTRKISTWITLQLNMNLTFLHKLSINFAFHIQYLFFTLQFMFLCNAISSLVLRFSFTGNIELTTRITNILLTPFHIINEVGFMRDS